MIVYMSVQFDGNTMMFDFIQLDLSSNEYYDPEFLSRMNYGHFEVADASAIGVLDVNLLSGLFWYRICDRDLSDNNETMFAMLPDSWPPLRFSEAMVTPETAISRTMPISEDFVRSIIRDIMGSRGLNCLFSNLEEMKAGVEGLDVQFDTLIRNLIGMVGGSFGIPKHLNEISPTGHLWNALINQEDALDPRRIDFIEQIQGKMQAYREMYHDTSFYYYGNDGVNGEGYYYPLSLSPHGTPEEEKIYFPDGFQFYWNNGKKGAMFVETKGLVDYRKFLNPYQSIDFLPDDIIKIRLNYHHAEPVIFNKVIHPRSYMLYLKLFKT